MKEGKMFDAVETKGYYGADIYDCLKQNGLHSEVENVAELE
jgi:hypothetical protein